MTQYRVYVSRTVTVVASIQADTRQEAEDRVREAWNSGNEYGEELPEPDWVFLAVEA